MADEGPSYSSATSTIDLRAKVMPLWETKGWLQQLQQAFVLTSVCLHVCVCVTPSCLSALHYSLSPRLPFFLNLRHLSPFLFLSSVMLRHVHAQNTEQCISLCIYHTCTCSPWHSIRQRERSGLHFSAGRQTSSGLFVNIWNEIRCRGCLSLKIGIIQPCSRINLSYILLSHWSRSVSIPNCIQSLLNKNKGLFYSH